MPANNATSDITLTSIGSQAVTITGNSVVRTAGTGDYNACVRGTAITGPQTIEADIIAVGYTIINLDDDATSFAFASMALNFSSCRRPEHGPVSATAPRSRLAHSARA